MLSCMFKRWESNVELYVQEMGSDMVGCFHLACQVQYSAVLELEAQ